MATTVGCHDGDGPVVAVLSDGSDFRREPGSSLMTVLLNWAVLIREHAGAPTSALRVSAGDTESLISDIRRVAADAAALYLTRIDPARAEAAQISLADTMTVITDRQAQAVALVAATLRALTTGGILPSAGRVVIVGASCNPLVATLAVAAGIGAIDSWGRDDAHNVLLSTLDRHAVVVDLLGCVEPAARPIGPAAGPEHDGPDRVITADDRTTASALPLLLAAARASTGLLGIVELLACVQALARTDLVDPIVAARRDAVTLPVSSASSAVV